MSLKHEVVVCFLHGWCLRKRERSLHQVFFFSNVRNGLGRRERRVWACLSHLRFHLCSLLQHFKGSGFSVYLTQHNVLRPNKNTRWEKELFLDNRAFVFFKVPLVRCNCQAYGTRSWPNQSCFHLVLYLCRTQGSSWAQSHVLAQTSLWSYGRNQLLSNILSQLSCLVSLRSHASFPLEQRNTIPSHRFSINLWSQFRFLLINKIFIWMKKVSILVHTW